MVRAADPAELNARLVRHGIRISELAEERRTLEEVVLAATTGSSDRVDGAVPPTMGVRSEVLSSDDSAWERPPPGPPMPLPTRRPTIPSPLQSPRPEPPRSEPDWTDPGLSEPGRWSEPDRSVLGWSQPRGSEPGRSDRTQPGPSQPGPTQPGPSQPGPSEPGPSQAGRPEPGWEPARSEPDGSEPGQAEAGRSEVGRPAPDQSEAPSEESA